MWYACCVSGGRSSQHRGLGDGTGYFRGRLSRIAAQDAQRLVAHGARQRGAVVGAIRGCYGKTADSCAAGASEKSLLLQPGRVIDTSKVALQFTTAEFVAKLEK